MNRLFYIIPGLLVLALLFFAGFKLFQTNKIRESVRYQLSNYPKSTLIDIYKNFFQDSFGPEHLIEDIAAAKEYLVSELASADSFRGPVLEQTGYKQRFYRVNLVLVKDGTIPVDSFFSLFIESSKNITHPSNDKWIKEWKSIETVIREMNLDILGYSNDKLFLDRLLHQGKFVVHHSEEFIIKYDPHYRIVLKSLFDKKIGKLSFGKE